MNFGEVVDGGRVPAALPLTTATLPTGMGEVKEVHIGSQSHSTSRREIHFRFLFGIKSSG